MRNSIIFILILLAGCAFSQSNKPEPYGPQPAVGSPMPDFVLPYVTHYKKKSVTLNDFKGKWLILDFWFTGCTACIESFPKINKLQQQYKDYVQFMMVGKKESTPFYKGIDKLYEKLREKQNLQIASAYDSAIFIQWGIWSMPHIIIVDPTGIVRAITGAQSITAENINDLINGKNVFFQPKDHSKAGLSTNQMSLVKDGKLSDDVLLYCSPSDGHQSPHRSVLTRWSGEKQYTGFKISQFVKIVKRNPEYAERGWCVQNMPLYVLYNYAYKGEGTWKSSLTHPLYGKVYPQPILEIQDSSAFQYQYSDTLVRGTYNYCLIVPVEKTSADYIMSEMQRDLHRVFGYKVSEERRQMPVWKLISTPEASAKLKTNGGEKSIGDGTGSNALATGFVANNISILQFLNLVTYYIRTGNPPVIDATGITHNIDITIDAIMTDALSVKRALQKNGLDLVKGTSEFTVIVIRDNY